MDDKQNPVIEAEIVEEAVQEDAVKTPVSSVPTNNNAEVLLALEDMIKHNIVSIDNLRGEQKKYREMLSDSFENDSTFKEHADKVKEVNKVKLATKQQILKQPSVVTVSEKVKNISSEIKEKQLTLSDYLLEYQRMTGFSEIEVDGEVRKIVNTCKVVKEEKGKK